MKKLNVGALVIQKPSFINETASVGIITKRLLMSERPHIEVYWCQNRKVTLHSEHEVEWYLIGGEFALWTIIDE
jgi:hypothetical protein